MMRELKIENGKCKMREVAKRLRNFTFYILHFTLLCSLSASALPLTWRADWPDCKPVESLVHRGTDVELQPTWYVNGAAAATNGWTFTTYVQTNAVGQWFGPLPGAAFSHTNDVGAAFYNVMVRAETPGGSVNYTAFARFRMLDSPGFTPGELPLLAKTIDFADVTVLNAPWPDASITNGFVSASSLTNYATRAELDAGWWSEWTATVVSAENISVTGLPYYIPLDEEHTESHGWYLPTSQGTIHLNLSDNSEADDVLSFNDHVDDWYLNYTATRHRVAAPVPTKPSDIGAASTNDVQLTPVYSQTPTLSEWTINPSGKFDEVIWDTGYGWLLSFDEYYIPTYNRDPNATSISAEDSDGTVYTATRVRTDIIGYTLGDQTTKPLQPQGDYAQASVLADIAETATNARETAGAAAAASSTNSANIATLNAQVSSIGAHINAEDAHFVSTNYDSVVRLPEAYVEIKMRDEATGSNTWITIWQEMRRWTAFVGSAFDWQTWQGFHTWATNITQELAFKADRCWGIYDSETGGYSPEGYTQISSSNILIAAGMAYQRTVTSDGAVWILRCNQGVAQMGGNTNGFFQVFDGDGVVQFEIVKGDRREVGANAGGITVDNSTSPATLTIPYGVIADEHPTLQICDDLTAANWKAETDPDCLANVEWSGLSGEYVATVQRKTAGVRLFVKATYMSGGETYIRNAAPVSMDSIVLNGVKYYLGTATISGHTVLTLSTTAP